MTKSEIQNLIDTAIAGQGSAVDVGGALPKILSNILALIPAEQVQADWSQHDSEEVDFIKHKPVFRITESFPVTNRLVVSGDILNFPLVEYRDRIYIHDNSAFDNVAIRQAVNDAISNDAIMSDFVTPIACIFADCVSDNISVKDDARRGDYIVIVYDEHEENPVCYAKFMTFEI